MDERNTHMQNFHFHYHKVEVEGDLHLQPRVDICAGKIQSIQVGEQGSSTGDATLFGNFAIDRARMMITNSNYDCALTILERESGDSFAKLLQAQCYLHKNEKDKADKTIDDIKSQFMTSSHIDVNEVLCYAKEKKDNSNWVQTIILLRVAFGMLNVEGATPDSVINCTQVCLEICSSVVEPMIENGGEMKNIAIHHGVSFMLTMYESMKNVENASPQNMALKLAWSAGYLGHDLILAGKEPESMEVRLEGIRSLEGEFRAKASRYLIYGYMLHNLGVAYFNRGQFSEAEDYYMKAIPARKSASDYINEDERAKDISVTRYNCRQTMDKLLENTEY